MLQDPQEIDEFIQLMLDEGVRSYLEIGSKHGGSLERIGARLPVGSRIVSVDLPYGTGVWAQSKPSLEKVIAVLNARGLEAQVIWGDSTDPKIVDQVKKLAPFDCLLIDANHTMPYIKADFDNYGPLARIVAFHDISYYREVGQPRVQIDVPVFWTSIKHRYRHREIRYAKNDCGIGIIWPV